MLSESLEKTAGSKGRKAAAAQPSLLAPSPCGPREGSEKHLCCGEDMLLARCLSATWVQSELGVGSKAAMGAGDLPPKG